MQPTERSALETPIEGLRATPPSPLPFGQDIVVRSFLLERPAGNVIVYNSPGLSAAADELRDLGEMTRLMINHGHEAMYGPPGIEAPVFVHERDRQAIGSKLPIAGTFTEHHTIGDDLEVIPTPGHTPGATAFLWDSGSHRFLFTGDTLWRRDGSWEAVLLDSGERNAYLESLALMRELDFDVLVPWGAIKDQPYIDVVSLAEARQRIDEIIARLRAGADH